MNEYGLSSNLADSIQSFTSADCTATDNRSVSVLQHTSSAERAPIIGSESSQPMLDISSDWVDLNGLELSTARATEERTLRNQNIVQDVLTLIQSCSGQEIYVPLVEMEDPHGDAFPVIFWATGVEPAEYQPLKERAKGADKATLEQCLNHAAIYRLRMFVEHGTHPEASKYNPNPIQSKQDLLSTLSNIYNDQTPPQSPTSLEQVPFTQQMTNAIIRITEAGIEEF